MMYPTIGKYPLFAVSDWPIAELPSLVLLAVLFILAFLFARNSQRRKQMRCLTERSFAPAGIAPKYERFTDRARKAMQLAYQEAQRFNHEYIGTEHILLGLIKEGGGVAANVLKNLDVDLRKIRLEVEKLVQSGPDMVTMGKLPQTPRAKKVIEYSMEEARKLNHNYVGTEHILLGLLREQEGVAAQVLMNLSLKVDAVRAEILALLGQPDRETRNTCDKPSSGPSSKPERAAVQCTANGCDNRATFHLAHVECRECAREEHLCEEHARTILDPYVRRPTDHPRTPDILQDARHFDIDLIVISELHDDQVVYLCEVGGDRLVPIRIGIFEATTLDRKVKGYLSPRPLTHDAMAAIIRTFGAEVQDVIVDNFEERTYYAKVRIRHGNDLLSVDVRPSDAFVLAVAFDRPIFFMDKVLNQVML